MRTIILLLLAIQLSGQIAINDKTKHFYVAMGTSVSVSELLYKRTDLGGLSPLLGVLTGMVVTIGKEVIYDKQLGLGTPSINDGIVGCFGSATGGIIHRICIDIKDKRDENNNTQENKIKEFENNN